MQSLLRMKTLPLKPMSPGGLENPPSVNPSRNEDMSERGDDALHTVNFNALFLDGMTGYEYVLSGAMKTVGWTRSTEDAGINRFRREKPTGARPWDYPPRNLPQVLSLRRVAVPDPL